MSEELKNLDKQHIMATYKRYDVVLERGEGCYVYDHSGRKYLDFVGGIATCSVGHANKQVVKAVSQQVDKLISVSNLYFSEPQVRLAHKLSKLSGLKKAFFSHSGADANETAIKLAKKVTGKQGFIAFQNGFHGRTTGSLALTWEKKYKQPFLPLTPNVEFAEYDNIKSLEALVSQDIAAIIVEPIQGEAGIVVPKSSFLKEVRAICDKHGLLMIIDEVQTGVGRTGKFFAYEHAAIKPDIVTLAKGLANGVPIGVCLSDYELEVGEHGSTLGGNSLSAAAALATIDFIEKHDLLANALNTGNYIISELKSLKKSQPLIKDVRGQGLMIGIVLNEEKARPMVEAAIGEGLLVNAAQPNVIRLLPPLIVTKAQAQEAISTLKKVMAS